MAQRWVWVGLLLGCTPKSPSESLPALVGRTAILASSTPTGWIGQVFDPEDPSALAPAAAFEVALVEYWASPAALGVRPGERLGDGPRDAPPPDRQRALTGGGWVEAAPTLHLRLPECPAGRPRLPSGYCEETCEGDLHDRGDGVCWPADRCLPGFRVDVSGCGLCGDGRITGPETCDDGGRQPGDGCDRACAVEDGWTCEPEPGICRALECGDGLRAGAEACDDGNATPGDGCDGACAVEPGWRCGGGGCEALECGDGRRVGAEACDDGNTAPGDGCDGACRSEVGWRCPIDGPCVADCGDRRRLGTEECDPPSPGCRACRVEDDWWCPEACERDTVVALGGDLGRRFECVKAHPVELENRGGALTLTSVVLDAGEGHAFTVNELSTCEGGKEVAGGGSCTLAVDYDPLSADDRAEVRVDYVRDGSVGRVRVPLQGQAWCRTLPPNLASTIGVTATTTTATLTIAGRYADDVWTLGWIGGRVASGRWQTLRLNGHLAALASMSPSLTCAAGESSDHAYTACFSSQGEVSRLDAEVPGRAAALAIGSGGAPFVAGWTGPGFPGAPDEGSAFVLALGPGDLEVERQAVIVGPTPGPLALAIEPGDTALHLVGTSSGGDVSWTRLSPALAPLASATFGTAAPDAGTHVVAHRCGVFIAGWTEGDRGGDKPRGLDVVVARLDPLTGARRWTAHIGGAGDERPVGLAVDQDGLVLVAIAGARNTVRGLDPIDGSPVLLAPLREELEVPGVPTGLALDADGRVFVSGQGTSAEEPSVCRNAAGVFVATFPRPDRSVSCVP